MKNFDSPKFLKWLKIWNGGSRFLSRSLMMYSLGSIRGAHQACSICRLFISPRLGSWAFLLTVSLVLTRCTSSSSTPACTDFGLCSEDQKELYPNFLLLESKVLWALEDDFPNNPYKLYIMPWKKNFHADHVSVVNVMVDHELVRHDNFLLVKQTWDFCSQLHFSMYLQTDLPEEKSKTS